MQSPHQPVPGFGQYAHFAPVPHNHPHEVTTLTEQSVDTTYIGNTAFRPDVVKRARGLKALCICDILFSIWGIVLGGTSGAVFLLFLIFILIDFIGYYAAHRLAKVPMSVFSFGKAFMLGLYLLYLANIISIWVHCGTYCTYGSVPLDAVLLASILVFQVLAVWLSVKLRRDILLAERAPTSASVELNSVQPQVPVLPQEPPSHVVPPVHPYAQDHHSISMGVHPGYPYPPTQYFPMPYMNQVPQGYPMPYGSPYPNPSMAAAHAPIPTYPAFSITDDQPQHHQQEPNRDTQPLV